MEPTAEPPRITTEELRSAAKTLREKSGEIPTLEEVARELGATRETCRDVLRKAAGISVTVSKNHRRSISAKMLGIHFDRRSKDRDALAEFSENLKTTRAKTVAIHAILDLAHARKISEPAARLLTYALMTRRYSLRALDMQYAAQFGGDHRHITNLLHGREAKRHRKIGILGELEHALRRDAGVIQRPTPIQSRARFFLGDCVSLARAAVEQDPLRFFLQSEELSAGFISGFGKLVGRVLADTWPEHLKIQQAQLKIIDNLIQQKSDGSFTLIKDFALQNNFAPASYSGIFDGRRGQLGFTGKLLEGVQLRVGNVPEELTAALQALKSLPKISTNQADLLREAVQAHRKSQDVPNATEKLVLQIAYERRVSGQSTTFQSIGDAIGLSQTAVLKVVNGAKAVDGRTGSIGLAARVARAQASTDPESRRALLNEVAPYNASALRHPLRMLGKIQPTTETIRLKKEQLLNVVEALINENDGQFAFSVSINERGRPAKRQLRTHEIAAIVKAFLGTHCFKLGDLQKDLSSIIGSRQPVRSTEHNLRRLLIGRDDGGRRTPGALKRLLQQIEPLRPLIQTLNEHSDSEMIDPDALTPPLSELPHIGWAYRITHAPTPVQSVHLTGIFCATRAHTFREIVRETMRQLTQDGQRSRSLILPELNRVFASSSLPITDPQAAAALRRVHDQCAHLPGNDAPLTMRSLLTAARARGVKTESLAIFLENILNQDEWARGVELIEEVALLSRNPAVPFDERRFARLTYERFLQRSFGHLGLHSLSKEARTNFSEILESAMTKARSMSATETRVAGYLKGFYETYSLDAVVKKFYWYLIQSPSNPKGLPYNMLMDAAHDGVLDAARRYDPDFSARTGRTATQFNSFAIGTLKFNIHSAVRQYNRDQALTPLHLEDRIRGDKEDTELGSVLTAASQRDESDDNLEYEAVLKGMETLTPVARRAIQLRFTLGTDIHDPDDPTLEEIADAVFDEKLSQTRLSRERIRQIIEKSLVQLRRASFSGTLPEWQGFFGAIHNHEAPRPLLVEPSEAPVMLAPGFELQFQPFERKKPLVLDIAQVFKTKAREFEITVRARDEETLDDLGLYEVTVSSGEMIACERVE